MPRGGGKSSSGGSSGGGRTYVNNASNRSLGRVGMPVGSMVVSSGGSRSNSSSYSSSSSSSSRTYVDNASNRSLGRVGMPVGSMVVPSGGSRSNSSSYSSSSSKTYVDNASNHSLGRVGMPVGSMVVSSGGSKLSSASPSTNTYVDNPHNRSLGRVGMPLGSMVESSGGSKSSSASLTSSDMKVYKDNAFNRRCGRVGKPIGSQVYSGSSKSNDPKVYVDNPTNRRLERVGFPLGSRPQASSSGSNRTYCDNALNRKLGRVGKKLGTAPMSRSKKTEFVKDTYRRARENPEADFDYLPDLGDEDELEAVDHVLDMLNRLNFEREWKEQSGTGNPPRTSTSVMQYSGPTVDYDDIQLGKVIGRGGFGLVYHAKWKGAVVAAKKLYVTRVSKRRLQAFKDEANVLSQLDHPFIVKFIGACTVTPNLCLLMEYMQMSLFEALHVDNEDLADFTDADRLLMISQTAQGMEYLHSKNIAHCDVKSQNILIDHDGEKFLVAKVTDFGLALMKSETETSQSSDQVVRNIGTPRYSAPEVLRGELLNIDQMKKGDMYSYALVVYEITCEEEPFARLNAHQLRVQVGERGLLPEFPRDLQIDDKLMAQLKACWDHSPDKRPTAGSFLSTVKNLSSVYKDQ